MDLSFLDGERRLLKRTCIYLGCEDQKTPMHIAPGSEHVLGGASEVGAAQETQDSDHIFIRFLGLFS